MWFILTLGYQIEHSVFELNRMKSNEDRKIKFDVVRSSTKSNSQKINANRTKSNVRLSSMRFDLVLSPNDT